MKKFIAPEIRIVRYDSSSICQTSVGVGDDWGAGGDDFDAPRRRSSIFEETETTKETLEPRKGLK